MMAMDPLFAPTRFDREFVNLGVLGQGGYGTVVTARHRVDHQVGVVGLGGWVWV